MSFIAAAATVLGTTGAVGIGTTMLAGGMMGAATGAVGNLIGGRGIFDNLGQNMLMGGATAGIASGIGSALGGQTQAAIDAAKAVPETTGNLASDMALKSANTIQQSGIDSMVDKATTAFNAPDSYAQFGDQGYNPADYRASLQSGQSPIDYGQMNPISETSGANSYSQPGIQNMLAQGMTPQQISAAALQDVTTNTGIPAAGMQTPGMQTKIGNFLVDNPTKAAGFASGLMSLKPNALTPAPVKPVSYYNATYEQPQFDPKTGLYSSGRFGPGTRSTVYGAQGGAIGYAEGDLVRPYPHTGDPIANTGGLGGRGEKPERSRNVYGDEESVYGDASGVGTFNDEGSIYSNSKVNKSTPAKQILAAGKAYAKAKKMRALLQDDDIEYAAQGGLMGTYAAGGKLLQGPGDGMSDSIPAVIGGPKPQRAALAQGEFVIPADVVSHLGNGSTDAGSKRLYAMMDRVRHARTGTKKQGRQINPAKFMPA
jgi:hypothetical protein